MPANLSSIRIFVPVIPPSFKNRKRVGLNRKTGHLMPFTDKKTKARMRQLEDGIVLALKSYSQAVDDKTLMASSPPLETLLSGLRDDCWTIIPEMSIKGRLAAEGEQAGIWITIERLTPQQD